MPKKINIVLSDKAVRELESLKEKLGLPSIAETVRGSISIAKFLEMEKEQGNEVILRNKRTNKERVLVTLK